MSGTIKDNIEKKEISFLDFIKQFSKVILGEFQSFLA